MLATKYQQKRQEQQERVETARQERIKELDNILDEIEPKLREREILARISEGIQVCDEFQDITSRRQKFEALCKSMRIIFSTRVLSDWQKLLLTDPELLHTTGNAGRPPLLDEVQQALLSGHILDQNNKGNKVTFHSLVDFCSTVLLVDMTEETVRGYCRKNGFAVHMAKVRANAGAASVINQAGQAFAFIRDLEEIGFYDLTLDRIFFIDSTFTSHRNKVQKTISAVGLYVNLVSFSFRIQHFSRSPLVLCHCVYLCQEQSGGLAAAVQALDQLYRQCGMCDWSNSGRRVFHAQSGDEPRCC